MYRHNIIYLTLVLAVPFILSGCSKEEDDSTPDYTCGRSFELIIRISPEGAGRVQKSEYVYAEGIGGLLPTKVIQLYAVSNEGYVFEEWKSSPTTSITKDTENPKLLIPCYISESVKTITITAVFRAIEEVGS